LPTTCALNDELKDAGRDRYECAPVKAPSSSSIRPADWLMAAVSGAAGLKPALAAVDRGTTIALANKECLVCAATSSCTRARRGVHSAADSEHNALFQALGSGNREELVRVIITASGGPFRPGERRYRTGHIGAGAKASELEHGTEDHHRFPRP